MFVQPMLAKAIKLEELSWKKWNNYVIEPKHDGMRAIVVITKDGPRIYGRSGKEYTSHVPQLVEELKKLPVGIILDGELIYSTNHVCWDAGIPIVNFNKTMRIMGSLPARAREMQTAMGPIKLIVWDILGYGNEPLVNQSWYRRRALLVSIYETYFNPSFIVILNAVWNVKDYYEGAEGAYYDLVSADVEGIILKEKNSFYLPGGRRANTWYKLKAEKTFDVVVMGGTKGTGKYSHLIGALEFGVYDYDGKLVYIGKCSGMTDEERERWTKYLAERKNSTPLQVIEIKSNDLVGSGKFRTPRHPQYLRVRTDKYPADCKIDQFLVEE